MDGMAWPIPDVLHRRPRWRVLVKGGPVEGVESVTVHSNNHYQCDTFEVKLALGARPDLLKTWTDADAPILVEVQAGFLSPLTDDEGSVQWQSVIVGELDKRVIHPLQGTVELKGRDLLKRLIDAKTRETFANQTASQVARTLAARHHLAADVETTSTLAGTFYQLEHTKVTTDGLGKETTEFELLVYLAKQEGLDLWITGNPVGSQSGGADGVLHMRRQPDLAAAPAIKLAYRPRNTDQPYPIFPVTDFHMERDDALSKGIKVTVKTWNAGKKSGSVVTYPSGASGSKAGSKAAPQEFVFLKPGLSHDAALKFAKAQYDDILKHERLMELSMPGELSITPRSVIELTGTGTSFDQRYYINSVERTFDVQGGFHQSLHLKNHKTDNDAQAL